MSNDALTSDKTARWEYLSSVVTLILVITLCALLIGASVGFLSIGAIPQAWFLLYSTLTTTACAWLFGREVVEWRQTR